MEPRSTRAVERKTMTNCNPEQKVKLVQVPEGGLWGCDQVAAYLNVSKSWVWKQCREKLGLPFIELGARNYRFDPAAVKAWVAQSHQQGQVG
ncbi:helix-turn-helix transcriptional regulator [Archangium lansingense]|uniref:Helix-turn-helix domain-containing protein n=1 Tax=Archangium lansingense TaxID=2995310 RepID=A0ABT4AFD7_9BACT|nr:helix-turn-helix domain-containing protein [Archangium lansinium]MCY1080276.1 helix-turn-helix domain-containing protein [Archangium lansinium]